MEMDPKKLERALSKRERRMRRQANKQAQANTFNNFKNSLREIVAKTDRQQDMFEQYDNGKHIVAHGAAGTGKTFLSLYLSLDDVLRENAYDRVVIMRSVVPTRDMGFLPGSLKEKIKIYESPYSAICSELFSRGDAYELLKSKGLVEFTTTSYIRGVTYDDCVIIVDEFQNLSFHEISSVVTRVGENARLIFCGDLRQTDLLYDRDKAGAAKFLDIVKRMKSFSLVNFVEDDIVRSKLVKEFIIQTNMYTDEFYSKQSRTTLTERV